MRRTDREKDTAFAIDVIARCEYVTLAMADKNNMPYCVPISPVLWDGAVYFHSAIIGTKCEIIAENKNVALCCVCDTELIPGKFSTKYKSAIVKGLCSLVLDTGERKNAMLAIAEKFAADNVSEAATYIEKYDTKTAVYKIVPIEITGKGNV